MKKRKDCAKCGDHVDLTACETNTVITIRDMDAKNKNERFYLCDLCSYSVKSWFKEK